tara:strand:- start:740 stop:2398 length:1659 start_codon:yes stop_codon:yes gene_type:complete
MNYKITKSKMTESKTNTECQICCDKFNNSTKAKVTCGHCNLDACKKCVRFYLLSTTSGAHCMGCKNAWDREFTQKSLNKSFFNGSFKNKRKEILFESEKARFPETMPAVENYKKIKDWRKEEIQMESSIMVLRERLWELERAKKKINNNIRRAKAGDLIDKKEQSKFIRKCPRDNCEGFLSSAWKCGVCNIWACSKCFAEKGFDKDAEHTCNADDLASAELIKKETKGCPACGTRIYKISGCDQMWCTCCHIAFSWRTGMRVNGVIHNPHFYQFQREGGNAVVQNPGAQICGGLPTYMQIRDRMIAMRRNDLFRAWAGMAFDNLIKNDHTYERYKKLWDNWYNGFESIINFAHRGANHFQYTILDRFRQHCQQALDNKELRIKFICGEINEEKMKTQLIKKDTQYNKRQALLHVYELMGAVYTECLIGIHNTMLEFINENNFKKHSHKQKTETTILQISRVQKCLKNIHTNIMKLERVRIYCNIELFKISGIYNQSVDIIDGEYSTPKFNKESCKNELTKKNCGELQIKYVFNTNRNRWQREMERPGKPVYI